MDRRSFDLNYENNILFYDLDLTAAMRQRQLGYVARSSLPRRLWNNSIATLGPSL